MKIVLIVVGAAAGPLAVMFLAACIAVAGAIECMRALEEITGMYCCEKCYSIGQSGKRIDLDSSKIMLSGKERSLGTDKGKT